MIEILAIGKDHEDYIRSGIERFSERLRPPYDVRFTLLPHSSLEGRASRREESARIMAKLDPSDYVILLDERGVQFDSRTLAGKLNMCLSRSLKTKIIIGGAYGVDETIMNRANLTWSLSKLVFPHQLVRLILLEQIYRSQEIERGSGYHHD